MDNTKKVTIVLISILLPLIFSGCGREEDKYVGAWVSQNGKSTIELKQDGSFKYDVEYDLLGVSQEATYSGNWELTKDGNEKWITFTPISMMYPPSLKVLGDNLVDIIGGTRYIKKK